MMPVNSQYRSDLETSEKDYAIADHITDLLGVRDVCLYENEVEIIVDCLKSEFEVISITDKTSDMESTEGSFGYKGVHVDLRLDSDRKKQKEYSAFAGFDFEIQIRSIIQDAWSAIDHKIKYKKSIPSSMKRRINLLAAMFELADREFLAIRKLTDEARESQENDFNAINLEASAEGEENRLVPDPEATKEKPHVLAPNYHPLDSFSFLRIANHFFPDFDFEDHKVDGFVSRITDLYPGISRGRFNLYMRETISRVKDYRNEMVETGLIMNEYTTIRHCLYMADPGHFTLMLNDDIRTNFKDWMVENNLQHFIDPTLN